MIYCRRDGFPNDYYLTLEQTKEFMFIDRGFMKMYLSACPASVCLHLCDVAPNTFVSAQRWQRASQTVKNSSSCGSRSFIVWNSDMPST